MKIKVCGLKDTENIKAVAALAPDYMGFICYSLTPRFIGALAPDALAALPETIYKTGVFVNENIESVNTFINSFKFNAVQLHGDESPEYCNELKGKIQVLKAFGLDENFDFERLKPYVNSVDFFLFDTKTEIYGGSGKIFDWNILDKYQLDVPFFLSGGISLDNLEEIKKINHLQFYGVDLNSRFEIEPGIKNIEELEKAFNMIKQFDTHEIRS